MYLARPHYNTLLPSGDIRIFPKGPATKGPRHLGLDKGPCDKRASQKGASTKGS
jgi:hypothetical protein